MTRIINILDFPKHFVDLFYAAFIRKAPELLSRYRESLRARVSKLRELIGDEVGAVLSDVPRGRNIDGCVAGVDGGIDSIRVEGGHSLVIARAVAVTNRGEVLVVEPVIDVVSASSDVIGVAYLTMVESLATLRAVEHGCSNVLIDGSYYARVIALTHNLILARHFDALFYLPEIAAALIALIRAMAEARSRGAETIFVSKDSRFTVLKEHLSLGAATRLADGEWGPMLRRLLNIYSVLWVKEFRRVVYEAYRSNPVSDFGNLLRLVLDRGVTDSVFLDSVARDHTFAVKPIMIGAADAYLNKRGMLTADSVYREAVRRLSDVVELGRPMDGLDELREELRWALSTAPKVWLSYVKLAADDSPMMVEVPAWSRGPMLDGSPIKAIDFGADVEQALELLASMYHDPEIYNTLLWRAHTYATVSGMDTAEYAEYLKSRLGIRVSRRVGIGLGI